MPMAHSLVMGARVSELAVVTWAVVATLLATVRPLGPRARVPLIGGACGLAIAALATTRLPNVGPAAMVRNVAPVLFVLWAYRLAGGFFIAPQPQLERRLLTLDRTLLAPLRLPVRLTTGSPMALEVLEAAYLSVYALLPLGAWSAWAQGGSTSVDRYWTIVFLAEASCYVALAWLQTRPPRELEPWAVSLRGRSLFRKANEAVLARGSHHMNTIPSGHAAGAVSVALALWSLGAPAAWLFAVVAVGICAATVVGRYHFVVDTAAGAAVAIGWWWIVTTAAR